MKDRIRVILEAINEGAFEREEAISLSLLIALAGESIFDCTNGHTPQDKFT